MKRTIFILGLLLVILPAVYAQQHLWTFTAGNAYCGSGSPITPTALHYTQPLSTVNTTVGAGIRI